MDRHRRVGGRGERVGGGRGRERRRRRAGGWPGRRGAARGRRRSPRGSPPIAAQPATPDGRRAEAELHGRGLEVAVGRARRRWSPAASRLSRASVERQVLGLRLHAVEHRRARGAARPRRAAASASTRAEATPNGGRSATTRRPPGVGSALERGRAGEVGEAGARRAADDRLEPDRIGRVVGQGEDTSRRRRRTGRAARRRRRRGLGSAGPAAGAGSERTTCANRRTRSSRPETASSAAKNHRPSSAARAWPSGSSAAAPSARAGAPREGPAVGSGRLDAPSQSPRSAGRRPDRPARGWRRGRGRTPRARGRRPGGRSAPRLPRRAARRRGRARRSATPATARARRGRAGGPRRRRRPSRGRAWPPPASPRARPPRRPRRVRRRRPPARAARQASQGFWPSPSRNRARASNRPSPEASSPGIAFARPGSNFAATNRAKVASSSPVSGRPSSVAPGPSRTSTPATPGCDRRSPADRGDDPRHRAADLGVDRVIGSGRRPCPRGRPGPARSTAAEGLSGPGRPGEGAVHHDVDPGRQAVAVEGRQEQVEPVGADGVLLGLAVEGLATGPVGQRVGEDDGRGAAVVEVSGQVPARDERVAPAAEAVERRGGRQVEADGAPAVDRRGDRRARREVRQLGEADRPEPDGRRGIAVDQDEHRLGGVGPDEP